MSTVALASELAWGREVDHEVASTARAAAVAAGQPSYDVKKVNGLVVGNRFSVSTDSAGNTVSTGASCYHVTTPGWV